MSLNIEATKSSDGTIILLSNDYICIRDLFNWNLIDVTNHLNDDNPIEGGSYLLTTIEDDAKYLIWKLVAHHNDTKLFKIVYEKQKFSYLAALEHLLSDPYYFKRLCGLGITTEAIGIDLTLTDFLQSHKTPDFHVDIFCMIHVVCRDLNCYIDTFYNNELWRLILNEKYSESQILRMINVYVETYFKCHVSKIRFKRLNLPWVFNTILEQNRSDHFFSILYRQVLTNDIFFNRPQSNNLLLLIATQKPNWLNIIFSPHSFVSAIHDLYIMPFIQTRSLHLLKLLDSRYIPWNIYYSCCVNLQEQEIWAAFEYLLSEKVSPSNFIIWMVKSIDLNDPSYRERYPWLVNLYDKLRHSPEFHLTLYNYLEYCPTKTPFQLYKLYMKMKSHGHTLFPWRNEKEQEYIQELQCHIDDIISQADLNNPHFLFDYQIIIHKFMNRSLTLTYKVINLQNGNILSSGPCQIHFRNRESHGQIPFKYYLDGVIDLGHHFITFSNFMWMKDDKLIRHRHHNNHHEMKELMTMIIDQLKYRLVDIREKSNPDITHRLKRPLTICFYSAPVLSLKDLLILKIRDSLISSGNLNDNVFSLVPAELQESILPRFFYHENIFQPSI